MGNKSLARVSITHVGVAKKTVKVRSLCSENDKFAIDGKAETLFL